MPYYFSCTMVLIFTDQSVYFHISNSDEIVTQWCLPMRLISFSVSYGKIMTLSVQPVITYIYLCERISASCLSYFSNRPSVMDQNLNCNVRLALENLFNICILSYTDSWCLVPFSINLSCGYTHKVCYAYRH